MNADEIALRAKLTDLYALDRAADRACATFNSARFNAERDRLIETLRAKLSPEQFAAVLRNLEESPD